MSVALMYNQTFNILYVYISIINITCLQAPTVAAAAYLRMAGRPPVLPSGNLSYAENFLYMLDSMYATIFLFLARHLNL